MVVTPAEGAKLSGAAPAAKTVGGRISGEACLLPALGGGDGAQVPKGQGRRAESLRQKDGAYFFPWDQSAGMMEAGLFAPVFFYYI